MKLGVGVIGLVVWLALLCAGCSTTGSVTPASVVAPKTVRPPVTVAAEVVPYLPGFVTALNESGFLVGPTNDPNAIDLRLEFNPNPFNLRVSASMWQRGVPLLTSSATNSGWGTAMARGVAVNGRADAPLEMFRSGLSELRARLTIVADQSQ